MIMVELDYFLASQLLHTAPVGIYFYFRKYQLLAFFCATLSNLKNDRKGQFFSLDTDACFANPHAFATATDALFAFIFCQVGPGLPGFSAQIAFDNEINVFKAGVGKIILAVIS